MKPRASRTAAVVASVPVETNRSRRIDGIIDAMNARMSFTALQWAVPIHPTVSELIPTVIGDLRPPL